MTTENELKNATVRELLYNVLLSTKRYVGDDDMPNELFEIEQSRDFGCREELEKRGYADQQIDELNKQAVQILKKGEVECPEALKFLLEDYLIACRIPR